MIRRLEADGCGRFGEGGNIEIRVWLQLPAHKIPIFGIIGTVRAALPAIGVFRDRAMSPLRDLRYYWCCE